MSVLVLVDISGCDPPEIKKIVTSNSTSKFQPLVIKNFKMHYRNFFITYIVAMFMSIKCYKENPDIKVDSRSLEESYS